ncbi:MAG: ligase-associated DNA damage response exonuclease [Cytophagaceae bacterium]
MLVFDQNGINCKPAGVYIDPWKPVTKAIITHAHSDHAYPGSGNYLCHPLSAPVLTYRLGEISLETVEYNSPVFINGVKISLHPAGHIPGSSQVRLEYRGEVWVVSGDYKIYNDGLSTPFEIIPCHHFITESTFGLPIYNFRKPVEVYQEINLWCKTNTELGITSVLLAYPLGKSQQILYHLAAENRVYSHGAVYNINQILRSAGLSLPESEKVEQGKIFPHKGSVVIAPPSAIGSPWLRKFEPYSVAICSGWMQLRGTRRRKGVDKGFALSDHADWISLNQTVKETGAENVYVTHGYKSQFSQWLREKYSLNALEVDTLYEGESIEKPSAEEMIFENAGGVL